MILIFDSKGVSFGGWNSNFSDDNTFNETLTYDLRGNIIPLQRNGLNGGSWTSNGYTAGTYGLIDDLTYTYGTGNQLTQVRDISLLDKGFKSVNNPNSTHYTYDANGNLKSDLNKGILLIEYNVLNLPQVITFTNNRQLQWVYDASGAKLRKMVLENGSVKETRDYVNGVEYKNRLLERVSHSEGAVVLNEYGNDQHEYVLRDHLGNTRVTFRDGTNKGHFFDWNTWSYKNLDPNYDDGIVTKDDIVQINNYYPFGLNMEGDWNGASGNNKYQYNGKEWNDDFGLGMNDYGRRFYDPSISRFFTQDRFAEKYLNLNPYQYGGNNPIKNIDVNGDSILITHGTGFLGLGKKETLVYNNGALSNRDGSKYTGKVRGFLKHTVSDLNKINSGGESGKSLIGFFNNTNNNVRISSGSGGNSTNGLKVSFDRSSYHGGLDVNGNTSRPTFIGLAHELVHAMENTKGTTDWNPWFTPVGAGGPVPKADISVSNYENRVRSENNIPLRAYYTDVIDPNAALLSGPTTAKYPLTEPAVSPLPVLVPKPILPDN
jgi:RHS repeat-associated protein